MLNQKLLQMIRIQPRSFASSPRQQEKDMQVRYWPVQPQTYPCETKIFSSVGMYMHMDYQINHIEVGMGETVYTVRIRSISPTTNNTPLYMTHGFGGTSLFYYDIAAILRRHSEIILFDLRGLGLSDKVDVEISDTQAIIGYFVEGVEKIRQFYKHTKMTMVAHSLGAYVCMLYASAYKHFVEKLVMFSPIGITPKQQDYKNKISSCKDLLQYLISQLGWKCQLTYKNLLHYFVCCCQQAVLRRMFRKQGNSEQRVEALTNIILRLLVEPLCSERLFFKIFEPRVLPVYDLEEHFRKYPPHCRMKMIFGIDDWVDKTGAKQLTVKYPNLCSYHQIAGADHNIFFFWREGLQQELIDFILN